MSALIFVALAVAWAAYLIPKALKHHDEVVRSRSVDRFSHTMRVLAHREPVNRRDARLVVTPGRAPAPPTVEAKAKVEARPEVPAAVRRRAAQRATRRRRRVLGTLLLVTVVVTGLALYGLFSRWWITAPVAAIAGWLVLCRVMVRGEQAARRVSAPADPAAADPVAPEATASDVDAGPETEEIAVVVDEVPVVPSLEPEQAGLWDPVPVTLPTYVDKPSAARRTVSTIDLDSTGVWSSGRSEVDSALAREAEETERTARQEAEAAEESEKRKHA